MEQTSAGSGPVDPGKWASVAGHAPGLSGLCGRILLRVGGATAGVLQIQESGEVAIIEAEDAATVCAVDTQETLVKMLAGEHAPMVSMLQGRVRSEGDHPFLLRVLFGLQAGSPWRPATPAS
jgi:hypothetical protein